MFEAEAARSRFVGVVQLEGGEEGEESADCGGERDGK